MDRARAVASPIVVVVCVAPNCSAVSRLNSTGSTAMTARAPMARAACTLLMPTPPTPMTMTTSPAWASDMWVTDPHPVATPQLTSAARSSGTSRSIFTADRTSTTVCSLSAEMPWACSTGLSW